MRVRLAETRGLGQGETRETLYETHPAKGYVLKLPSVAGHSLAENGTGSIVVPPLHSGSAKILRASPACGIRLV